MGCKLFPMSRSRIASHQQNMFPLQKHCRRGGAAEATCHVCATVRVSVLEWEWEGGAWGTVGTLAASVGMRFESGSFGSASAMSSGMP